MVVRECLRRTIPEIAEAANYLDAAADAHLNDDSSRCRELLLRANIPQIRVWTESLWGPSSTHLNGRSVENSPPYLPKAQRVGRMPSSADKQRLIERDGYHCRFCGNPLIRAEIRQVLSKAYPFEAPWGKRNRDQHAAFQALWLQFDHILPHSRGGTSDLSNLVVTCAPCNFGRGDKTLEEVGLAHPILRDPIRSNWDGLERLIKKRAVG